MKMIRRLNLTDQQKGYLYALLATIFFSNIYIFSKAALNEISLAKFLFYWFTIASILNFVIAWKKGAFGKLKGLKLKDYRIFLLLGFIEIVTTTTFYIALKIIPDPAVASFMGNMFVVFQVLLGVILLKERFTKIESVGVVITIVGAFAAGYNGGSSISDFFIAGTGIVLINTFTNALSSIVAKKAIVSFAPSLINFNRTFFMFLFGVIYFLISDESISIPISALLNIVIGVVLGSVIAMLMIYNSYKYIEASRSSVLQGLKGVFVLLGTFIYFQTFPNTIQLVGGIVSIVGVLIMTLAKAKLISND